MKLGTGIPGPAPCFCPYCGHKGEADRFFTKDQIEFTKSAVRRYAHGEILRMLKRHEGPVGRQDGFIRMSIEVTGSPAPKLFSYREQDLESELTCSACTLCYTIYGVFAFCPDCGQHNSEQILNKNLDTIERMLALGDQQEEQLRRQIIEDALENAVSTFDGFGREYTRLLNLVNSTNKAPFSFQNIEAAKDRLFRDHHIDMSAGIPADEWSAVVRGFQKRHLLAPSLGVVDERYLAATCDSQAMKGRKISVTKEEVRLLIASLRRTGGAMIQAQTARRGGHFNGEV